MSTEPMDAEEEFLVGAACFKAGNAQEGAHHLRNAAKAGHAQAQNQLARVYFAQLKTRQDILSLEGAAQQGDHVAMFVLAMSFLEGRIIEKDTEKAITVLRYAANAGNLMAQAMLGGNGEEASEEEPEE